MDSQSARIYRQDSYCITWLAPLFGSIGEEQDILDDPEERVALSTRIIGIGSKACHFVQQLHQWNPLSFDSYWRFDYILIDSAPSLSQPFSIQEPDMRPVGGVTVSDDHLRSLTKDAHVVIYVVESDSQLTQKLLKDPFFKEKNDAAFTVGVIIGQPLIDNTLEKQLESADSIYHLPMEPTEKVLEYLSEFMFNLNEPYTAHGLICVDIADVRYVVKQSGLLRHSWSMADNATKAATQAIEYFSTRTLRHAAGAIVLVTGSESLSLGDFEDAGRVINDALSEKAILVIALKIDSAYGSNFKVSIILAGG